MNHIKTKSCNISNDQLNSIKVFFETYGVSDFHYGITTKKIVSEIIGFKKLTRRLPQEMLNARYSIFSTDKIRRFRHSYLESFANSDNGYKQTNVLGANVWREPDYTGTKGEQFKRLMNEHGIVSRGVWFLPVKYNPDWFAVFVFFSPLEREALNQSLKTHQATIHQQLELYSSLFNEQFIAQLNPISNFNCLSAKAIQVLELTAQGYSCEEIGEQLVMTESGVHYHQNRLKELFNAKNRAQLVSFAHSLGVLN
ncbi:helix-turn-helix transcriptional regulator [Shewanella sp. 125m-7]